MGNISEKEKGRKMEAAKLDEITKYDQNTYGVKESLQSLTSRVASKNSVKLPGPGNW